MAERTALSAIEAMRNLLVRIDPMVEGLMEAHELRLESLNATADEASVEFAGLPPNPWKIAIRQSIAGDLSVRLIGSNADPEWLCLSVRVGAGPAQTLPQALGLALSLIGFAGQLAT